MARSRVEDYGPPKVRTVKAWEYVGLWWNGTPGWYIGPHVGGVGKRRTNGVYNVPPWAQGARLYLCEITMRPLKDKRGRFITRITKRR